MGPVYATRIVGTQRRGTPRGAAHAMGWSAAGALGRRRFSFPVAFRLLSLHRRVSPSLCHCSRLSVPSDRPWRRAPRSGASTCRRGYRTAVAVGFAAFPAAVRAAVRAAAATVEEAAAVSRGCRGTATPCSPMRRRVRTARATHTTRHTTRAFQAGTRATFSHRSKRSRAHGVWAARERRSRRRGTRPEPRRYDAPRGGE